jgi:hypothetical protein
MLNLTSMMMTARIILGTTTGDERHIIKCYMRSTDKETHSCKHFSCSKKFALQTVICLAKREVQLNSQHIFLLFLLWFFMIWFSFLLWNRNSCVLHYVCCLSKTDKHSLSLPLSPSLSPLLIYSLSRKRNHFFHSNVH